MPSYEMAQSGWDVWFGKAQWLGLRHVVAGSVAGFCGSMVKVPMDVVKKRLQAGLYPNIGVAFSAIAKEGGGKLLPGILRFYTGWRSAIVYDIPYNAVQFSVLENVKNVARKVKNEDIQGFDNVAVGAVTGVITSLVTEPLDVVKTRMMTQRVRGAVSDVTVTVYTGWLHCVKTMVKEEGVAALWKGTLPRLVWVGASSAVWYGTYQMTREALGKRRVAKAQRKQQSQNFMPHALRRDVETNKIHMLKL